MANAATHPPAPPQTYFPLAALLSYLVPGLGQIQQGRVAKGLLFLVCLYGMFFYGMYLGNWQNVYIPESPPPKDGKPERSRVLDNLTDRARFIGQFCIGVAAWPAIVQYATQPSAAEIPEKLSATLGRPPTMTEIDNAAREWHKGVLWPHPLLGGYMRAPDEGELNKLLQNSDKKPDLGWMYTVIAGVLNVLVIYDAFAGPAFGAAPPKLVPAPPAGEEKAAP